MTDDELSRGIEEHVRNLSRSAGHPLSGKLTKKAKVKGTVLSTPMVHLGTTDEEYVEIADSLFFFYAPATILRWPKPVVGDLKRFTVQVQPEGDIPLFGVMDSGKLNGFEGLFRIDEDGVLTVRQQNGFPVTVVALGNPGPEFGVNTVC